MSSIRVIYLTSLGFFASFFGDAAAIGITGFLIPSILMGVGVGIDVFIATIAKYRDQTLSWKTWTIPVVCTHVSFPALGYFLFWMLSSSLPVAQAFLGIIGFILVALFIYEVICESVGTEPIFGISEWISHKFGFQENDSRIFITVLAVSWDALWSGPAKSAQATAGQWGTNEVILSFVIAGLVVAVIAELALFLAYFLRNKNFKNPVSVTRFTIIGKYLELSVIAGFGVLSLWRGFSEEASLYYSIAISGLTILFIFIVVKQGLWRQQMRESRAMAKS